MEARLKQARYVHKPQARRLGDVIRARMPWKCCLLLIEQQGQLRIHPLVALLEVVHFTAGKNKFSLRQIKFSPRQVEVAASQVELLSD